MLQDNELLGGVDVTITANTANLLGGDIHEWYFNLPDKFSSLDARDFTLSNFGGVSNKGIGSFTMLGPDPSIAGGSRASFEWGVNFGNGGGKNGNGQLTTATFNIDAAGGLEVQDFLDAEFSYPNNTPPVLEAVHFQGTGRFRGNRGDGRRAAHTHLDESGTVERGNLAGDGRNLCRCRHISLA